MAVSYIKTGNPALATTRVEQDVDNAPFGIAWTSGSNFLGGYGLIVTLGNASDKVQFGIRVATKNILMRRCYHGTWTNPETIV